MVRLQKFERRTRELQEEVSALNTKQFDLKDEVRTLKREVGTILMT